MSRGTIKNLLFGLLFPLLGILLVIQMRADGHFPFPKDFPENSMLLVVFLHTLTLSLCVFRCIYLLISNTIFPSITKQSIIWLSTTVVPVLALMAICVIHIIQTEKFSGMGYQLDSYVLFKYFIFALFPLAGYWVYVGQKKIHCLYLFLICVLVSSLIIKIVPLQNFPINPTRSDMLPIIKEGALKVLSGADDIYIAI